MTVVLRDFLYRAGLAPGRYRVRELLDAQARLERRETYIRRQLGTHLDHRTEGKLEAALEQIENEQLAIARLAGGGAVDGDGNYIDDGEGLVSCYWHRINGCVERGSRAEFLAGVPSGACPDCTEKALAAYEASEPHSSVDTTDPKGTA
jgi:hypothetical protein